MGPRTVGVGGRQAVERGNRILPASELTECPTLFTLERPLVWSEPHRLLHRRKRLSGPPHAIQRVRQGKIASRRVRLERHHPLDFRKLGLRGILVAQSSIVLCQVNMGPEIALVTSLMRLQRGNRFVPQTQLSVSRALL